MVKRYNIKFHPETFKVLGEQLVSDPVIAIQELVKNAYDADSRTCAVIIDTANGKIIIEDEGHGMNEEAIEKGWLLVGTPLKRENILSRSKKRYLTGSMGVGRLSAFSLGNDIEIITTSDDDHITRNFSLHLKVLLKLDSFDNYYVEVEENEYSRKKGTKIIITNLKPIFDDDFLSRLKRMLSILLAPPEEDKKKKIKNDFIITVKYDDEISTLNPRRELAQYNIKVNCNVDNNGFAYVDIVGNKDKYLGDKNLEFDSKLLIHKYTELKNIKIELYWYLHGQRSATLWVPAPSDFSQDLRAGFSGIRIYRDRMRVLPYGEIEDDSFNIDKRYVSLGAKAKRPRNVQLIGWIFISRESNRNLIDTSNREGLVNNEAFKQLYSLVEAVIDEFIDYRVIVEETPEDEKLTVEDSNAVKTKINNVKKQLKFISKSKDELPKNMTREKLQKNLERDFDKISDYLYKVDHALDVAALMRDRVTAGNMINHILHYVGAATRISKLYIEQAQKQICEVNSHDIAFTRIMDLLPRVLAAYDVLKGGSRGVEGRKEFTIFERTKSLVNNMLISSSLRSEQVKLTCSNIEVSMRESDYWAVVANLLLNSITCHEYEHANGRMFAPRDQREIHLTISSTNKDLVIQCEDNGPGLPEKPTGWIWQQFTSTRQPAGSGLGLFIISEIVNYYGGIKIATSSRRYDNGSHFYIHIKDVVV